MNFTIVLWLLLLVVTYLIGYKAGYLKSKEDSYREEVDSIKSRLDFINKLESEEKENDRNKH